MLLVRKLSDVNMVVSLFGTLPDSYEPLITAPKNLRDDEIMLNHVEQRLLSEGMKQQERYHDSTVSTRSMEKKRGSSRRNSTTAATSVKKHCKEEFSSE